MKKVSVIFVCLGNICRSPTAHGVFRQLVNDKGWANHIEIDSAGTAAYHVGKQADARSRSVAKQRGIAMDDLRARKVDLGDIIEFDYILAMDETNYADLLEMALPEHRHKIRLFLEFAPQFNQKEVPDPYYGGADGFNFVFDLVEAASVGLLADIEQKYLHK
ncbi:low molecular weight protein-tyrosine-phosphatase [Thiosulfativibrio zosterae]|uniref:protein-tyrosine-phosphatase n=1 Tax=Thiosulfativibrio zosterae TaxID=2675053 RepID=A0A6F8PPE9_9GAMM|nr:low molecular weight protein-tyrosine-phosphatase [Thiosulfativibrio zosterae]BBP43924.1 phosphotyrosine protein phosphatase [Thiosulfativibrio zosterae]